VKPESFDAGHEMKRGLWWMGGATVAMRLLDVGGTLIVLQFLGLREMGLATLAWSVAVALEAFNGLGLNQVVVRERDLTHRQLSGLFWFATLFGVAMLVLAAVLAPFLAIFYADWRLYPLIIAGGSKLVFVGAALVPLQLLTRDLHFKTSGAAQTAATLGESVTKVVLVAAGFGAWGLVLANVSRGLFLCLALWWLAPFRPALAAEDATTRRAVRFGSKAAAASILYHVYRNLDFLLIGRVLGQRALGVYRVAFDLGMTPLEIVLNLVNRVQFPIYSRLREDARAVVEAFNRSARSLLLVLGPVAALICFASPDILALIGGGKWLPAVPLIQVLAWASLLRGIAQLFPQLYNATGRPGLAVYDSLLTGITLVVGFTLALWLAPAELGAMAVAWVWLLTYPITLWAHFRWVRSCAAVTAGGMAAELAGPVLGVLLLSLVLGLLSLLRPLMLAPVLMLILLVAAGAATYLVYLRRVLGITPGNLLPRRP
jgi:O-antigen/teichoic acid export membrane protein